MSSNSFNKSKMVLKKKDSFPVNPLAIAKYAVWGSYFAILIIILTVQPIHRHIIWCIIFYKPQFQLLVRDVFFILL